MNVLQGPVADSLGWTLLHHLWQGTLLALIAVSSLRLMARRSPNARYLTACGFLLLMVSLPVATAIRIYEPVAVFEVPLHGLSSSTFFSAGSDLAIAAPFETPWTYRAERFAARMLPWVVALWIAGVAVLSLRLLIGWMKTRRLAAGGRPVAVEWNHSIARIAKSLRMTRGVRLLQSVQVQVPMVIGWVRPVILVPASALTGLTAAQLETIFAHELAHIRRHDYLVNLLQVVAETVFFYHPAVWWMSSVIREERENCCDDLAVAVCGNPVLYARALANLEGLRSEAVAIAANGGSLRARVMRLVGLSPARCSHRWVTGASILTFAAAVAVAAPMAFFGNDPEPLADLEKKKTPIAVEMPKIIEEKVAIPAPAALPAQLSVLGEEILLDENAVKEDAVEDPESMLDDASAPSLFEAVIPASEIEFISRSIQLRPDGLIFANPRSRLREYAPAVIQVATLGEETTPKPPATPPPPRRRWNGELSVDQLIALRVAGVDGTYIRALRSLGYGELSFEDLINLRRHGVSPQFIAHLNEIGGRHMSADDLVALQNAGVTIQYIEDLRDGGFETLSVAALVAARSAGITGQFIDALHDAGMKNLSINDVVRLFQSGVDETFLRALNTDGEDEDE